MTPSADDTTEVVFIVAWTAGLEWSIDAVGDAPSPALFEAAVAHHASFAPERAEGLRALRIQGRGAGDLARALCGLVVGPASDPRSSSVYKGAGGTMQQGVVWGTITVDGTDTTLEGWLREADQAFLWWGPRPPFLDDSYADFGWLLFRNGRYVEPYFARKGAGVQGNPNDPPFPLIRLSTAP